MARGSQLVCFFFCDRWWLAHRSMAEVTMVFSVRGRQRFEGFHSWKVQCCLWLCPTSLFLVVFETLQLFAMSQSQKGTLGDTKWSHVKSTKCSRMQQLNLEVHIYNIYIYLITYWKCWCCSEFCEEMALMYFFFCAANIIGATFGTSFAFGCQVCE